MRFIDTETCGLMGPIVLIQYADDDGPVVLYNVWEQPVKRTLELLREICSLDTCAYNATFDWFQINKLYNMFYEIPDTRRPPDHNFRFTYERTWCCKPKSCLDLYLYALKSQWQILMNRKDIRIKRVPRAIAKSLCRLLDAKIHLPDICFNKRPNGYKWIIEDSDDYLLADVVLRFAPSSKLKALVTEVFKISTKELPIPKELLPDEDEYNPYGKAYRKGWREVILQQMDYWYNNTQARSYAELDIIYLQRLYHYFRNPKGGDDDSELAASVGAIRYKGFSFSHGKMQPTIKKARKAIPKCNCNINSPAQSKVYLKSKASPTEQIMISDTSKETLESLKHLSSPLGLATNTLIEARKASKIIDLSNKLLTVGRFCPAFRIIGTKSSRMSGGTGLKGSINPQGISKEPGVRDWFTLADDGEVLSGGDFSAFEITIADAVYGDEALHQDLLAGKKFHGLLGELLYDMKYDGVVADPKLYGRAKNTSFAVFYGAHAYRIAKTAEVDEETATELLKKLTKKYPKVGESRKIIMDAFCSMTQPDGLGTQVIWKEPQDQIESLLGFSRIFTIENLIVKALYDLAGSLPKELVFPGITIQRKKGRKQTVKGACRSALYSAAFQLQASNMRAAFNHVIQSTGAEITKRLQRNIWDMQPSGIHKWKVRAINIHDEILVVHLPEATERIEYVVKRTVEDLQKVVPLLKIDWKKNMSSWAEKE